MTESLSLKRNSKSDLQFINHLEQTMQPTYIYLNMCT
jgi:hypothetical protein